MGAGDTGSDVHDESIHSYLPLHALLKYNPPLEAVEAVVRACPGAVRCVTFEGSALKIAALCGSSAQVLRFLLVAEISTRKKPHDKFTGYNPIRWISEPGIKAKTAALLLKFYPQGAFQRPRSGGDLCDGVEDEFDVESPLIQIADAFARDRLGRHEDLRLDGQCELEYSSRSERERRWEKFLYILFATDCALQSRGERREAKAREDTTFYPVHAFLRCLTEPKLSLCEVRPYGCWSILAVMSERIPSELTKKDNTNRSAFQTLVEHKRALCVLWQEEVRDILECLMDADFKSAHAPRASDGRLVGHVALENGWPCQTLFKKKAATCA